MPGTNGAFDPVASYARLSERVEGQGRDIADLRSNMNTGFRNVEGSLKHLADTVAGGTKTQWPVIWSAIGVSFAIIVAIGGLAYAPVNRAIDRVETTVGTLSDKIVTRQEMDWRQARSQEDRSRTDTAIVELRNSSVTRNEWSERNRARDQEIADVSRRVDEIRQEVGAVYGTRDVIVDLKKEIDILRRTVNGSSKLH